MMNEEFFDRLFDVINETDDLNVADIRANNSDKSIVIALEDGSNFRIQLNDALAAKQC